MNNTKSYLVSLRISIAWLEKYIEIANYYSDWKQRKQTDDSFIIRKDINELKEKVLWPLGTSLMTGFEGELDEESVETREDLKQEFYKWLNTSQINVDNAPVELKCALFDFHEILECRFGKARKDRASRKREYEMDSPEYLEKMVETFSKSQQVTHSGKVHEMDASRFNGDSQTGKATFIAIANSLSAAEKENFHFWPQPPSINNEKKRKQIRHKNETKPTSEKEEPKTQKTILIIGVIFIAILSLIGLVYYWKKKNEKRK